MRVQMLIRFLLIIFCLSMMIASAKADIHQGIEWYQKRNMGLIDISGSESPSIKLLNITQMKSKHGYEKDAVLYQLKTYY